MPSRIVFATAGVGVARDCADRRAQLRRVRLVGELRHRHRHERRIGELLVAIDERALIRRAEEVRVLRAAERRHASEALEDVQRFGNRSRRPTTTAAS